MFSRLLASSVVIASLFSLTAQAKELLVEVSHGETIKVNVENINTLATVFLKEAEKNDIPAISVDGIPFIGRQAFYDYAEAASKVILIKEYSNKGILFTIVRIDEKVAILVDDDLLSVDSNSEPAPAGWFNRCTAAVIAGAVSGGAPMAAGGAQIGFVIGGGPVGAGVGAAGGFVVGAATGGAIAWSQTDACSEQSDKSEASDSDTEGGSEG